ncbi:MAG: sodium:solute symporter family protein [Fibrobacterota bacterium]
MTNEIILWTIIGGYMLFIVVKGLLKAREIHDSDDFIVAGRNVAWFPLLCTMGATVIGGGASIGAIGKTYDWGLLMLVVSTGWYLHFILSGLLVAPQFREARLYTVAGFFGLRFGEKPRFVMLVLSLLFSVFVVAAQMAAFGSVLSAILPQFAGAKSVLRLAILVGGIIVVAYSTAGGLKAVIATDKYQFIILLAGFAVTLSFCIPDITHSWDTVRERIKPEFFLLHGGKGWLFLVTTFLAFFLGETFAPGYVTRYCVGRNIKETKIGIVGAGVFLALVFPVVLFFIAIYARLHFPNANPQEALPLVLKELNNPVVGGLMIGALFMAVMSSADSALNSTTAIFVKDLFEHQLKMKESKPGRMLALARLCTIALGGIAILIAILWSDIIGLLLFTYHIWAPAVILPVILGAIKREKSMQYSRPVFITMVATTLVTLTYRFIPVLETHALGRHLPPEVFSFIRQCDPSVFGVFFSLLCFAGIVSAGRLVKGNRLNFN